MSAALHQASVATPVREVFVAPPEVDQVERAVAAYRRLRKNGRELRLITRSSVLKERMRERAPMELRDKVRTYANFSDELWKKVFGTAPVRVDKFTVDLAEFRDRLRAPHVAPLDRLQVVVLQGQQLPPEFYALLRLLRVSATVFVDPVQTLDDAGESSSLRQVAASLGVGTPTALDPDGGTAEISALLTRLDGRYAPAALPRASGPRPELVAHDNLDDELASIVELAGEHRSDSIGVLVQTRNLVESFRDGLENLFDGAIQWYLSGPRIPEQSRITGPTPGIKVLTWASAVGMRFDRVVLAALDRVDGVEVVENSLRVLGATARRQLVLSYSGEGRPTTLRNLPQELLDDRTGRAAAAGLDSVLIPGPGSGGEDDESPHDAVGSARAVLKLRVSDSARSKRLLSAQEEVGLAQLMRGGPDRDLSAELPRGFRGQLAGGDERARAFDAMVLHNLGLVWSNVRPHLGSDLGEEDLKQHGVLGLMRAIEKWDGTRGLKFSTYATHWINQSMGRAVPDEGRVIRIPVHKYEVVRKVARTEQALLRELQEPTVANIAHRAGLSLPEVVECLRLAHGIVSLDKPLGSDGDDLTLADVLPLSFEDDANPDHVVDREMGAALVRQAMSTLRERDRMVLRMRHGFENDGEPMTLEKIGEHFSLTRERIRQIESKALPKLKAKLVEFGLQPGVSDSLPVKKRKSRGGTCTGQPLPPGDGPQSPGVELATGSDLVSRFGVTDEDSTVTGLLVALVDRARLSGARRVEVRTSGRGTSWALALGHDGVPFAGAVLREALCAVAAPSSGSAALGMAAVLYDEVAAWDVASGRECSLLTSAPGTNTWWLHRAQREIPDGLVPKQWTGPWSVLLLRAPRLQVARARMDVVLENCVRELGVVFGELLGSGFSIEVNGIAVTAQDPFLWNNPAGQHLGEEVVSAAGRWAVVSPRVLPHPDALRPGDSSSVGNPEEWRRSQGFYVRGDGRYLSCGGWLGLDGLDMAEGTALARVLVDLEFGELAAWGEDRPGARIAPPEPLRPRLAALARLAREKSELVMGRQRSRGTA